MSLSQSHNAPVAYLLPGGRQQHQYDVFFLRIQFPPPQKTYALSPTNLIKSPMPLPHQPWLPVFRNGCCTVTAEPANACEVFNCVPTDTLLPSGFCFPAHPIPPVLTYPKKHIPGVAPTQMLVAVGGVPVKTWGKASARKISPLLCKVAQILVETRNIVIELDHDPLWFLCSKRKDKE